jgi:hypothetical protein
VFEICLPASRYKGFGDWVRSCYSTPLASGSLSAGATSVTLKIPAGKTVDRVRLEEDQSKGQMVVAYTVEAQQDPAAGGGGGGGSWVPFSAGVTIGAKRIDIAQAPVSASALRFTVTSGFGKPTGVKMFAFSPEGCDPTPFEYEV